MKSKIDGHSSARVSPTPARRSSASTPACAHQTSALTSHPKYKDKTTSKRRGGDSGGKAAKPKLKCDECGRQTAQYYCVDCIIDTGIVALCGPRTGRSCMMQHADRGGPKPRWTSPRRSGAARQTGTA